MRLFTAKPTFRACMLSGAAMIAAIAGPAMAQDADALAAIEARLERLEAENARLRGEVEALRQPTTLQPRQADATTAQYDRLPDADGKRDTVAERGDDTIDGVESTALVGIDPEYGYAMLDHAERTNSKPLYQLQAIAAERLSNPVTLSGGVTALANLQLSNVDNNFGYLTRHPTGANQSGKRVSEIVLHSAQLAVTAQLTDGITGYAEFLYDPQQSFGAGTITSLTRNQIQLRRGWIMVGDLQKAPVYALIGKMDVPFGLNDTVSPFTNSTNWHAFAGLAYGGTVGLYSDGFHLRAMAVQGGAQFRAANAPVNGTGIPSKVNNFAVDGNYTAKLADFASATLGASYIHGSAYCQGYPVVHFNPCQDNNPAWSAYGTARIGDFELLGEYAETTKVWPGTRVPDPTNPLSVFEAVPATAFTFGGRYGFGEEWADARREFALSAEFSRFTAGDEGAPWETQSQFVAGLSWFPVGNVNLFGEYVLAEGFVPLNFLSGGNLPGGATISRQDVNTNVFLLGIQGSF